MEFEFSAAVIEWRGPAPFVFAVVPASASETIAEMASALTYCWGCISVEGWLDGTRFTTSLFPKDGGYLVPLKAAVRPEGLAAGDTVTLRLAFTIQG
mgnify:CR=1 FL=1